MSGLVVAIMVMLAGIVMYGLVDPELFKTYLSDLRHSDITCAPKNQSIHIGATYHVPKDARVLVTGAAGFIGSHVATYLAETLKLTVIATDDLSGGFMSNVPSSVTFVLGDLKNDSFVDVLIATHGPFHTIYHLAAYAAEGLSHFIRKFNYRNNLVSSAALLNAAVRNDVKNFVFTSSIAAYGHIKPPMRESDTPQPCDPYGIAKYAFELDLKAAHEMWPSLNYVIFRPHNVYGPHQNIIDKYRNVIGIFMSSIIRGLPLPVFGDGTQTRAFTHINDVAPIIAVSPFVPEALNRVFNLGSDIPYSLNQLAEVVSSAMNVTTNIQYLPARNEVHQAHSDHSLSQCVFGLSSTVSLVDGINDVARWVQQKNSVGGGFVPVEFDDVEVMEGMPPSWITETMRRNDEKKSHQRKS